MWGGDRARAIHLTKMVLARARWFDKSYRALSKEDWILRKHRSSAAIEAYAKAFDSIQAMIVDAPRDKKWFDAYFARLKPLTHEAARANYVWWLSRERGEHHETVLKWADAALDRYRRGIAFVLDEYEKVFGERLE